MLVGHGRHVQSDTRHLQVQGQQGLDKMEDPRDTLDLSYEKQLEQLQKVRRGVADVATARKRIELQARDCRSRPTSCRSRPRRRWRRERGSRREALSRRAALGEQLASSDAARPDQRAGAEARPDVAGASDTRRALPHQKETMKLLHRGRSQTKVGEAVSGISDSTRSAGATMQRAQDKIAGMQARPAPSTSCWRRRARRPVPPGRRHSEGIDKVSSTSQVDNELAR